MSMHFLLFLLVVMISEVVCFDVSIWWSALVTLICDSQTYHIC